MKTLIPLIFYVLMQATFITMLYKSYHDRTYRRWNLKTVAMTAMVIMFGTASVVAGKVCW